METDNDKMTYFVVLLEIYVAMADNYQFIFKQEVVPIAFLEWYLLHRFFCFS